MHTSISIDECICRSRALHIVSQRRHLTFLPCIRSQYTWTLCMQSDYQSRCKCSGVVWRLLTSGEHGIFTCRLFHRSWKWALVALGTVSSFGSFKISCSKFRNVVIFQQVWHCNGYTFTYTEYCVIFRGNRIRKTSWLNPWQFVGVTTVYNMSKLE